MTELDTKLDRIVAALKASLELAEKATPAPWKTEIGMDATVVRNVSHNLLRSTFILGDAIYHKENAADAAFIAHARTMFPATARALLEVILWMRDAADFCANGEPANMTAKHLLFIADTFTDL